MEKQRIVVSNPDDRNALAIILVKNGYTVRVVKERQGNKTTMFVEYWSGECDQEKIG